MSSPLEASLSVLIMSIGSSAAVALGLSPNPNTNKLEKDREMARFNIDLLVVLQQKTKGNLSQEESGLLDQIVSDLQMKFVHFEKA
jgi:hypothetical protein